MQIKKVLLYKKNKPVRILTFKLGQVNIITGESKTGKTAIIDIINYCLGSKSCKVKGEVLIKHVEYFGVVLDLNDAEVIIIRQNPYFLNQDTTNDIHFQYGMDITIPEYHDIKTNSNISSLISFLTEKMNIGDNLHIPDSFSRESLSANFKHSRIFCFQPQNVIAEYKYLFFDQDESWVEQAIKDTLPYFLGAVQDKDISIRNELNDLNRQLNRLKRKEKEFRILKSEGIDQLDSVIEEAIEVDLINKSILECSFDEKLARLKTIEYNIPSNSINNFGENQRLDELQERKRSLKKQIDEVNYEIKTTEKFLENTSTYENEAHHQKSRLKSIGLYQEPNENQQWNVLIGEYTDYIPPLLEEINKSLKKLENNLQITNNGTPKFAEYLKNFIEKRRKLDIEFQKINLQIDSIYKEKEEIDNIKNENIRKGKIIGKIELLLESIEELKSDSTLSESISILEAKKNQLEEQISFENVQEKIDSAINRINHIMAGWLKKINFEYKNAILRFSPKKLTVYVETPSLSLPLNRIGGAENWLACHLFIHLALHKFFIESNRPVPNFLIFDQPTQVHYPENYIETPEKRLVSQDEQADIDMFNFLMEIANDLSPNLQIIITDHAHFHYKEFEEKIQEIWRNGKKLVPIDWYS